MTPRRLLPLGLGLVVILGAIWYLWYLLLPTPIEDREGEPAGAADTVSAEPRAGYQDEEKPAPRRLPADALSVAPAAVSPPPPSAAFDVDERARRVLEAEMAPLKRDGLVGDRRPVDRMLAAHSPEELDLVALLNRADSEAPPGLKKLFELRRKGASSFEQKRFVRATFRGDPQVKLLTLKWIDDRDPASPKDLPPPPPGDRGETDLGSVEQVERVGKSAKTP